MSGYTVLMHSQHEGYYSPNTGSGNDYKRDRYLFQGVFRVENHGDAEIDLINSRDNTQARTKVPGRIIESGKTAIVNYLVRKSNSRASIDAGQAKLAADAIERYVQSHFNTELHHSEDLDVIVTDDYLQHGVTLQQVRRNYTYQKTEMNYNGYTMGSRKVPYVKVWFKTTEKPMDAKMTPDPYYAIIDVEHIPLNGNRAAAIKTELKKYFGEMQLISDSELNKATYGALEAVNPIMNDRASDATHRPQHAGYYSPNLRVRHSLFTEVYDSNGSRRNSS